MLLLHLPFLRMGLDHLSSSCSKNRITSVYFFIFLFPIPKLKQTNKKLLNNLKIVKMLPRSQRSTHVDCSMFTDSHRDKEPAVCQQRHNWKGRQRRNPIRGLLANDKRKESDLESISSNDYGTGHYTKTTKGSCRESIKHCD